ncbi:MAG: hypothetical protein RQ748_13255, partial [Elusimicrobiales bacterium]|nr:hypothetical protein [Elusimicrobiales bacterium]
SSFFIEDVSFGGDFGLYENNISATAALGLLAVAAEMVGTVDEQSGKFFGAGVNFELRNPDDAGSRLTFDEIIALLNAKKFLYADGGFIDGSVEGGLGLSLALRPDGALGGLPLSESLGAITITAGSDIYNWLLGMPTPEIVFDGGAWQDVLASLQNLSFDDIIAILRQVVGVLQNLEGTAEVFDFKIPVI